MYPKRPDSAYQNKGREWGVCVWESLGNNLPSILIGIGRKGKKKKMLERSPGAEDGPAGRREKK